MAVREELKELLLELGIDKEVVDAINPAWPLMRHIFDSLGYARFVVALEERFGFRVFDRYSLRIRSLDDFSCLVERSRTDRPEK